MVDKTKELKEFKSDDTQSEVPEPIATGDKKRSADQSNGEKSIPQFATKVEAMAAAVSAFSNLTTLQISDYLAGLGKEKNTRPLDKNVVSNPPSAGKMAKESVEELFAGADDLSEDFKEKTAVVFEAAVNVKAGIETARIEEEFETKLTEAVDEIRTELTEKADKYMDYVAQKWLDENQVALENSLKVQMAEDFMTKLRDLMTEHSIVLPENIEVVTDMESKLQEANAKLADAVDQLAEMGDQIESYQRDEAFSKIAEGLALTQAERLRELAEGLDYESIEDYSSKVETIKETYFGKKTPTTKDLNEETFEQTEINEEKTPTNLSPSMKGYTSHLRRATGS